MKINLHMSGLVLSSDLIVSDLANWEGFKASFSIKVESSFTGIILD